MYTLVFIFILPLIISSSEIIWSNVMQNVGARLHSGPNNVLSSASYDRKQVNHINSEYENYITIIKSYH